MLSTFAKLNLKDQKSVVVLNAPKSFERELAALGGVNILRDLKGRDDIEFSLAFVTTQAEVDSLAKTVAGRAEGDAVIWFAYPKQTSKKYKCEFNRDTGWNILGKLGFECVRSVAIDEDWSGVRFRRVEFIKSMTRDKSRILTAKGQARRSGRR